VGALEGWGMERGVLCPREGVWGGAVPPLQKIFWIFYCLRMTCFGAFWHYFEYTVTIHTAGRMYRQIRHVGKRLSTCPQISVIQKALFAKIYVL